MPSPATERLVARFLHHLKETSDLNGAVAWRRMRRQGRWGRRYAAEVRSRLRSALRDTPWGGALVFSADPHEEEGDTTAATVHFEAPRSARDPRFCLQDCLPRRVGGGRRRRRLLAWLGTELADALRSVSKGALREAIGLLHRVLPADIADASALTSWTAERWLQAYASAMGGTGHRRIAFGTFKRHLRVLNVVQNQLLGSLAGGEKPEPRIPVPTTAGGRIPPANDGGALFGTSGSPAVDERETARRRAMRTEVLRLRLRLCRPHDPQAHAERRYAFSVEEGHRILEAALTTRERLVVLLLFSTGLRLGGLCRIRWPAGRGTPRVPHEVPSEMWTTEKNGVPRCIPLSAVCRVFVCRWMKERAAAPTESEFLFPGIRDPTRSMGLRAAWALCAAVLRRAGVVGPHAHPHTFRHTVVQLLYLAGGLSFETISKWIGHRSVSVTSGVYGRLEHADLQARLQGVPFGAPGEDTRRAAWRGLAERIRTPPYEVSAAELEGLVSAVTTTTATTNDEDARRRRDRIVAASVIARNLSPHIQDKVKHVVLSSGQ